MSKKMRKYRLIANKLKLIYKSKDKPVQYAVTLGGLVPTYHKKYIKIVGIPKISKYISNLECWKAPTKAYNLSEGVEIENTMQKELM